LTCAAPLAANDGAAQGGTQMFPGQQVLAQIGRSDGQSALLVQDCAPAHEMP
jgi:hypothetical protein